jgi:alpha-D-xyloside xylohydrolase
MRALFIEYPGDAGAWLVDDAYLFGADMLVAPFFESVESRDVYLPGGKWIDYQTGKVYNPGWHHIKAGEVPAVILVRDGAAIPHIGLAQSTKDMDWSNLDLRVFASDARTAKGFVCLPSDLNLVEVELQRSGNRFSLKSNPLQQQGTRLNVR